MPSQTIEFSSRENRNAFSTAFNIQSKFITNQFKLNSIPISAFEESKFLPSSILFKSEFISAPVNKKNILINICKTKQRDDYDRLFYSVGAAPFQLKGRVDSLYRRIQEERAQSPLQVHHRAAEPPAKKLKRFVSVPGSLHASPRAMSSMSVRSYEPRSCQQSQVQ
ncbi:hypothetical protein SS50377_24316 [Spironucleus salmonicida]|uniref:Uncharacterized protein n=1 Tax=Spironucleus salmonicida TaxID=348837 RepID=V6LQZ8_9EUKA|nr:hypothetical protein SS50377_24316 [Spironucleus salmonicida]|eukprot:EST46131.1 Hypothetical protein SS50377_14128 [Spironucleus salmonicida]